MQSVCLSLRLFGLFLVGGLEVVCVPYERVRALVIHVFIYYSVGRGSGRFAGDLAEVIRKITLGSPKYPLGEM